MFQTVWYYHSCLGGWHWRKVFFYAGSIDYTGSTLTASACVWMVPRFNNMWDC